MGDVCKGRTSRDRGGPGWHPESPHSRGMGGEINHIQEIGGIVSFQKILMQQKNIAIFLG